MGPYTGGKPLNLASALKSVFFLPRELGGREDDGLGVEGEEREGEREKKRTENERGRQTVIPTPSPPLPELGTLLHLFKPHL